MLPRKLAPFQKDDLQRATCRLFTQLLEALRLPEAMSSWVQSGGHRPLLGVVQLGSMGSLPSARGLRGVWGALSAAAMGDLKGKHLATSGWRW